METQDEAKYFPHKVAWLTLNKLDEFDKYPKLIEDLADKFEHLTSHTIYHKFAPLYREAVNYYNEHGKFPDLPYLNSRFPEGKVIEYITGIQYSITLYDKLRKQLDYEIIIQDFNEKIGYSEFIDMQSCMDFSKKLAVFANTNSEIPLDTKEDWINSYDKAVKEYRGISTGIKQVDEKIGPFSNLVTIASPSGNGKSTFALSLAYNMSTYRHPRMGRGANVLYISFEMSKFELLARLASIESSFSENHNERIRATDIRTCNLDEKGRTLYKKHINNFTQRLNYSGGYVALVDNTSMTGYNSIEGFMASIEELSEKLDKKFDIIFIDNVDSLKVLRGDRGQDEMAKMNSFITKLDAFTKTYADNYGTTIVLLSQTNRDGYKKLKSMEASGTQETTIDYTVLQQYSALYERATMVLVLYSSALMRANNQLKLMPVKLRNKSLPNQPYTLVTKWDYSYVGGTYKPPKRTEDDINVNNNTDGTMEEELIASMVTNDVIIEESSDIDTLMDKLQFNKYYKKNNKDYKIEKIDYSNMDFKISVKDMNKIFGRSIKEKTEKGNINIVESLSKKKFFLINNKGKIKYEKAFSMIIIGDYLKFKFNSYLIGRVYDMRKNFFEDIETMYEAIFFELLFNKTKTYNKKPIDKFIFTTRSILKDLLLEELVKAHKIHVISILNTCFSKAFKKGIFTEKFEFSLENFKKDDKTIITIPINTSFQWHTK